MKKTIHMCISVRGLLGWPKRDFDRFSKSFKHANGKQMTPQEARESLYDELSLGHEVIPLGEPCDGFDYKTGCHGHEVKEEV